VGAIFLIQHVPPEYAESGNPTCPITPVFVHRSEDVSGSCCSRKQECQIMTVVLIALFISPGSP
jgi:hypothetical protein